LKTRFNMIIPPTPRSSKWLLSLSPPHQNHICTVGYTTKRLTDIKTSVLWLSVHVVISRHVMLLAAFYVLFPLTLRRKFRFCDI
jgi:hypothetical protein